jgi:hypothetical protein
MLPEEQRSPHMAGSGNSDCLGGRIDDTSEKSQAHGLLSRWQCVRAASKDRLIAKADLASLIAVLDRVSHESGLAWPGFGTISKDARVARSTAIRAVGRLVERGYLQRESGGQGRSNRYRIGSTRSTDETSSDFATSDELRTAGSAQSGTGVVANPGPEPASLNLPNEPASLEPLLLTADAASDSASRFADFWAVWPKREDKDDAENVWRAKKLDKVADTIIADVVARVARFQGWRERQYIPGPAKYLRRKRWLDEWDTPPTKASAPAEAAATEFNDAAMRRLGAAR